MRVHDRGVARTMEGQKRKTIERESDRDGEKETERESER